MLTVSDLGILADDLTGACDAAAAFASRVGPVSVILDPPPGGSAAAGPGLVVLNTQSRLLSPAASRRRRQADGGLRRSRGPSGASR
jgi:uncharacterized protein YgbK (DUF1537 family)